ncbi:MAG TPA: diguanylate cyclase [Solirubrobacteraceae bacterium]|jgi:diguanylate cyclase (GGDEF)-like protein/PAS domain S-box-containing protein
MGEVSGSAQQVESRHGELLASALVRLPETSVLLFDPGLRVLFASGEVFAGGSQDQLQLVAEPLERVIGPDQLTFFEALFREAVQGKASTVEAWSGDGLSCYSVSVERLTAAGQEAAGRAVFRDITRRRHADEARRQAQDRFELMFEHAPIGMALLTSEGRLVRVNRALLEMTGHTPEELITKSITELTHADDRSSDAEKLRRVLAGEITDYRAHKRYLHARGHVISARLSLSVVRDRDHKPLHFIAQIEDLSEQKLLEARLAQLEERDPLTELTNRRHFEHQLTSWVTRADGGGQATLVVLDLDDFSSINEGYGYKAGDELLALIAGELSRRLRGTDLIARLDGDQFAVILPDTACEQASAVAESLAAAIAQCSISMAGARVGVTASFGVAQIRPSADEHTALGEAERTMRAGRASRSSLSLKVLPARGE